MSEGKHFRFYTSNMVILTSFTTCKRSRDQKQLFLPGLKIQLRKNLNGINLVNRNSPGTLEEQNRQFAKVFHFFILYFGRCRRSSPAGYPNPNSNPNPNPNTNPNPKPKP